MSGLTAGVIPKLFAKLTTSADGAITLQATAVKPIKVKIRFSIFQEKSFAKNRIFLFDNTF